MAHADATGYRTRPVTNSGGTTMAATIILENDQLRLVIAPAAGASVVALERRWAGAWLPILRPTPAADIEAGKSSAMASFVLAPFSNRIRDARFRFAGRTFALVPNTPEGHAIHGDVRKRPWTVVAQSAERLRCAFASRAHADIAFPVPYESSLEARLEADTAVLELALRNVGTTPMPAGLGHHPYFRRTLLDPGEQVALAATLAAVYEGLLPEGPPRALHPEEDFSRSRALPTHGFDNCFAGFAGHARMLWPGSGIGLDLSADPVFSHAILFTPPDQPFFAFEPVSHVNDGFNLMARGIAGTGVVVLAPGEGLTGRISFRIGPA